MAAVEVSVVRSIRTSTTRLSPYCLNSPAGSTTALVIPNSKYKLSLFNQFPVDINAPPYVTTDVLVRMVTKFSGRYRLKPYSVMVRYSSCWRSLLNSEYTVGICLKAPTQGMVSPGAAEKK